jgi:hypothetical protein
MKPKLKRKRQSDAIMEHIAACDSVRDSIESLPVREVATIHELISAARIVAYPDNVRTSQSDKRRLQDALVIFDGVEV